MRTPNSASGPLDELRVPIVIGVTGHRDIVGIPELEDRVREIFVDLHKRFPHTPLVLLSPLAEGADRLVVRVAKRLVEETYDIRFAVPLPMPIDDYAADFVAPDSMDEFNQLSEGAASFVIPPVGAPKMDARASRDRQYAAVGAYIARHSQVLIALWDGVEPKSECGAGAIVGFKLRGIPEPYAPCPGLLDSVQTGPVYHIVTPRASSKETPADAYKLLVKFPKSWQGEALDDPDWGQLLDRWMSHRKGSPLRNRSRVFAAALWCAELWMRAKAGINRLFERAEPAAESGPEESYKHTLRHIERFNSDIVGIRGLPAQWEKSGDELLAKHEQSELPGDAGRVFARYAIADVLAKHYRSTRRGATLQLFSLAVALGLVYELYAHWLMAFEPYKPAIALYPVVFLVAWVVYRRATKRRVQQKHLDYRALAEGMRVQLFWRIAGIDDDVTAHYLRQQRSEIDWICFAIRSWCMHAEAGDITTFPRQAQAESVSKAALDTVRLRWVNREASYFGQSNRTRHDVLALHEFAAELFLLLGISVSVWLTIGYLFPSGGAHETARAGHGIWDKLWEEKSIMIMGLAPVIAAATAGYAHKMAYSAEAKQFQRMTDVFMLAANRLCHLMKSGDYEDARALIADLGYEALAENASWVLLHRERPMEVPVG